jgi:transcriptional activator for dhaKLM operon
MDCVWRIILQISFFTRRIDLDGSGVLGRMSHMLPTAYPVSHEALQHVWQDYMATGQLVAEDGITPDPAVIQSWRRCSPRLDPRATPRPAVLKDSALTAVLNAQRDLITIATPFLEDIHQFIEGSGCAVLLTDGAACVLELVGDRTAVTDLQERNLGRGTYWSEGQLGTTALGLCLLVAMPVQVVGAEHYFAVCHDLVTTAAPIHAVNGRIIGTIAVVGPVASATSHTLSLVMAVARALSNQLHLEWLLAETNRHLSEVNTLLTAVHEGVIAWNEAGQITHINPQAADMLDLLPSAVMGQPLANVLTLSPLIAEAADSRAGLNDVETHLLVNGRAIPLLANLRPVMAGTTQIAGYILMIRPIAQVRRLVQQQIGTQAALTLDDFPAHSAAMRQVLRQATIAARGKVPVLLRGEGGVGKNWLAHAIHNAGPGEQMPFIAINCRAIPHELMLREFLGYEEEATSHGRPSKFELADGGSLLFDQIEYLSLEMQAALLYIIETGHVLRLNGNYPVPVKTRIMAATAVNLEAYVVDGRFLPQLYYRFGIFNLTVPPLRQRMDDLPLLAERYLARVTQRDGRATWIDDEAMTVLLRYPWPGNVRELESTLEWAVNQARDDRICLDDLPLVVRNGRVLTPDTPQPQPVLTVPQMEREAIMRAGWNCQGRVAEMAQQLGIGRTTLWRKMKQLEITPEQFKIRNEK